jgi:putative ABC transport system permease protein
VSDLLTIARRNLLRRWHRSLITITGIALGAAAYFILVTSAQGLREEFQATVDTLGVDILVQRKGAALPQLSHLSPADVAAVRGAPHVRDAAGAVVGITGNGATFQFVFGLDLGRPTPVKSRILAGRLPRPTAGELAAGSATARRLALSPGDTIEIMGRDRFRVACVYETGRSFLDNAAVIDLPDAQRIFNMGGDVNLLLVQTDAPDLLDDLVGQLGRACPGLDVQPSRNLFQNRFHDLAKVEQFSRYLALVALAIAALGVANTMNMNVAERIPEIGILRAVGWRRRRIAALLLLETTAVALTGALAGAAVAWTVLRLMASPDTGAAMGVTWFVPAGISPATLGEGVALSLAAGVLGSLGAMVRALRLQPARALRSWT